MPRIGATGAGELLDAAADLSPELRARLLAALARIPLNSDIWQGLSAKVVNLTDDVEPDPASKPDPATEPSVVVQAAMLPLTRADRPARWNQIAEFLPMPRAIRELRKQLGADPGAEDAAEMLACLPIEDHGVTPKVFARTIASESGRTALWAAIAAGRVGDFAPIDTFLDELAAEDGLELPFPGRWSAYRTLAQARPIPTALDAHLTVRGKPTADIVVWALTGAADVDGIPIDDDEDVDLGWVDDTAEPADPDALTALLLGPEALEASPLSERLAPSSLNALARVDLATAGRIVTNLLDLLTHHAAEGISWRDEYPDPVIKVVSALPERYSLPAFDLLVRYLSVPGGDAYQTFARRFAFGLARADVDDVLSGFAQAVAWAVENGGPESAALVDIISLLERVAYWTADTPAPWAGPTAAAIDVGRTRAYRDIGAIVKRSQRFDDFGHTGIFGIDTGGFSGYSMGYAGSEFGGQVSTGIRTSGPPAGLGIDHPRISYPGLREFIRPRLWPRVRWPRARPQPGAPPPIELRDDRSEPDNEPPEPPEPAEEADGPQVRRVRADVFLDGDTAPRDTFARGQDHRVEVWIGHDRDAHPHTVKADTVFVEGAVAHDPGPTTTLQVTFSAGGQVQTAPLLLPNDPELSSEPCAFGLTVAADQAKVSALIIISQPGRTLQQLVLAGETVGAQPIRAIGDEIALTTEVAARPLEGTTTSTPFDVSIHTSSAGGSSVVIQDGKACMAAPWDENIRPTVNDIAAKIYAAGKAAAIGDGQPEWVALILLLAMKGAQLHSWLKDKPGYEKLPPAQRVQVVDADATRPLPFELVYDGARLKTTAVPCPNWDNALATGHCEHCDAPPQITTDPASFWSESICPLGFWGLTKVIERQTGTTAAVPGRLDLLSSAMFAASDNVRAEDYKTTVKVLTDALPNPPAVATAWEQWPKIITDHRPTLIVALPHQDRDADLNIDYLEIGANSQLYSGQVMDMLQTDGAPGPVVLLLGCRTGNAKATFQNFVAEFRTAGAPIVLGTIATVLGRDAAAIAQEFVGELAAARAAAGGNAILFGEAMRTVRRLMIAKKKAAVLGLMAFGDSEWQVEVGV